jgi:hypothetical protein
MRDDDEAILEAAFVAGFRSAPDRQAFLALAGIPTNLARPGLPDLNLVEVKIEETSRVGAAAPGFATRALSYQPLPGAMIRSTTRLAFVYVAADATESRSLASLRQSDHEHSHDHAHPHDHGHGHGHAVRR